MKVLITGSSGYIGVRVLRFLQAQGHQVIVASRRPPETSSLWLSFDLDAPSELNLPEGIDAILHLAADTSGRSNDGLQEIASARLLVAAAKEVGAQFVFVSSQTARENAPTSYGLTKWHIEQEVLAANGIVVRLGQVYGGRDRGLFGTLVRIVCNFPVLPAFVPPPLVQPIHVDDCVKGLLSFIESKDIPSGVYSLASSEAVSFTTFLRSIARYRVHRMRFYIPVPVSFVKLLKRLLGERLSKSLGLLRLSSLFDLPPLHPAPDLDTVGLKLRTLRSGMHRSGSDRRRRLIIEGSAFLAYILRGKPSTTLVRRYVRMIENLREGTPLTLPSWLFFMPTTLALLDESVFANSPSGEEFGWRMDATTVIAEASVEGAARFIGTAHSTAAPIALLRMSLALISELFWRLLRLLVFPLLIWRLKREGQ